MKALVLVSQHERVRRTVFLRSIVRAVADADLESLFPCEGCKSQIHSEALAMTHADLVELGI